MVVTRPALGGNPPAASPERTDGPPPDPGTLTALRCPLCDGPVYEPAPGQLTCPACAGRPHPALPPATFTVKELAERCGTGVDFVKAEVRRGHLVPWQPPDGRPRAMRFTVEAIAAWLETPWAKRWLGEPHVAARRAAFQAKQSAAG